MNVDIRTEPTTVDRFCKLRERIAALVEFSSTGGGRPPEHVAVFAGDYRFLQSSITRRLRQEARERERAQNEGRKRRDRVKIAVEPVEGLLFGDIPLQSVGYSRHRKVEP